MAYISDTVARIKRQRIELRRDFQVVLDNLDDEAAELEDLALQCEKLMSRNLTAAEESLVENALNAVEDFLDRVDDVRNTMKAEPSWIKKA